jgi:hypothetical protein
MTKKPLLRKPLLKKMKPSKFSFGLPLPLSYFFPFFFSLHILHCSILIMISMLATSFLCCFKLVIMLAKKGFGREKRVRDLSFENDEKFSKGRFSDLLFYISHETICSIVISLDG